MKEPGHLFATQMDGRGYDVAGRLPEQLHDALAQVRIDHLDATRLQVGVQTALFGQHRLAFDHAPHVAGGQQLMHDTVVGGGIARPVHLDTAGARLCLELLQVAIQMREHVRLDLRGQSPQFLHSGTSAAARSRFSRTCQSSASCHCTRSALAAKRAASRA